ncbi:ArsR/SmtB family transcription factor [Bacillus paranthracis]|uniref:ArsR/SmtB family transcription factor n=1 Tax=Bacillus paranthracis TaxID=2026186 RepID=UPI0021D1E6C2|nr:ArsR family transcriptional regulator [Bacillus paranthracis]MCU5208850.1 ArsR family transcriptional regulator [Bacillus paranthracis]
MENQIVYQELFGHNLLITDVIDAFQSSIKRNIDEISSVYNEKWDILNDYYKGKIITESHQVLQVEVIYNKSNYSNPWICTAWEYDLNKQDIEMEAQLLKSLGNPVRLLIVKEIFKHRMCNVKKLEDVLSITQSTISKCLAQLRNDGIVAYKQLGAEKHYFVFNNQVIKILQLLTPQPLEEISAFS